MKNWLLFIGFFLIIITSTYASNKIAIINIDSIFQQLAQETGVFVKLESELKYRISELQEIENNLQRKMQRLQRSSSIIKLSEREKLEKDLMTQRQIFSQKAQAFEQYRQRRYNEERSKLITRIRDTVKKVVSNKEVDLVIDANAVVFNNTYVQDITADVLKQVR